MLVRFTQIEVEGSDEVLTEALRGLQAVGFHPVVAQSDGKPVKPKALAGPTKAKVHRVPKVPASELASDYVPRPGSLADVITKALAEGPMVRREISAAVNRAGKDTTEASINTMLQSLSGRGLVTSEGGKWRLIT